MLVHLYSRSPHPGHCLLAAALWRIAEGLRASGLDVEFDVRPAPAAHPSTHVDTSTAELRGHWERRAPDIVHTFGVAATAAALRAHPEVPIVATFDDSPVDAELELELGRQVAAVLPLSSVEHAQARSQGLTTLWSGPFPLPVSAALVDPCADPDGYVVTAATDKDLLEVVASMRHWSGRLLVLSELDADHLSELHHQADALDVGDRIAVATGLRGAEREEMWASAALLYAGEHGSRHAADVLEAAAHGVPALAVSAGAHEDVVASGTTGLVIPHMGPWNLGHAIAELLSDSFSIRAMGTAALVRVRNGHAEALAAERLTRLYEQALTGAHETEAIPVPSPTVDRAQRDALALQHLPLARQLAGWYSGRGQSREDLLQVASLGLVRAAERFDPAHGREFHSFAIPTILGELRKHFRDNAWAVRVPRGLQETTLQVHRAVEQLRQSTGREPSVGEIAEHLGLVEQEVILALQANEEARASHSLDHTIGDDGSVASLVGDLDPALDAVELRRDVHTALAQLPAREQKILLMRFYGEHTQAEIAERLGISQVHVSRVLARTLAAIRDHVLYDVPLPRSWEKERAAEIPTPRTAS